MENLEYPKAKYHATEPVKVVNDKEQDLELGSDWYDNPNDAVAKAEPAKRGPGRPKSTE